MREISQLNNQMALLNSTFKMPNPTNSNYDFDILNPAENINMDIQFILNLFLFVLAIKNLKNVKKWCYEKQVKPYKLYCINSNALLVLICDFLFFFPFSNVFKAGSYINPIPFISIFMERIFLIIFMWHLKI